MLTTLTESVSAALDLTTDDWLKDAQTAVGQWLAACCAKDERAFVRVQTDLVPSSNRDRQGILWTWSFRPGTMPYVNSRDGRSR